MVDPKTFPTPAHAWRRIARMMCVYGGEFDRNFYEALLKETDLAAPQIEVLQKEHGAEFHKWYRCQLWGIELCGSFEVTHPRYVPPKGSERPEANVLYGIMNKIFGLENEPDVK